MKFLARFVLDVLTIALIIAFTLVALTLYELYLDVSAEATSIYLLDEVLRDVTFVLSEMFLVAIIVAVSWWE